MLNKTLLGSAAVLMTMVGAQAADLPSKKAAPATYVKICDAYGAGFFFIPGTDTCLKIGGRVRADYSMVRAQDTYSALGTRAVPGSTAYSIAQKSGTSSATTIVPGQPSGTPYAAGTTIGTVTSTKPSTGAPVVSIAKDAAHVLGWEARGRIDFDARTNTPWGTVQATAGLRLARTTGVVDVSSGPTTTAAGPTLEYAYVRFAGFTFGAARDNFAFMPSLV